MPLDGKQIPTSPAKTSFVAGIGGVARVVAGIVTVLGAVLTTVVPGTEERAMRARVDSVAEMFEPGRGPASETDLAFRDYVIDLAKARPNQSLLVFQRLRERHAVLKHAFDYTTEYDSSLLDLQNEWATFAGAHMPGPIVQIDTMRAILNEPVHTPSGRRILQKFDSTQKRVAQASCTRPDSQPIIVYDPYAIAGLLPNTLRFLKHHEVGHFVKGDVDCDRRPRYSPTYRERSADCWAVDTLLPLGVTGRLSIETSAQYILSTRHPADAHYDTAHVRAGYLLDRCQSNPPR